MATIGEIYALVNQIVLNQKILHYQIQDINKQLSEIRSDQAKGRK